MGEVPHEKKIIIDEDWKSRVEAEKVAPPQAAASAPEPAVPRPAGDAAQSEPGELPPASLTTLVGMLAMQAYVALGQIANPVTGKAEIDAATARHFIDLLRVIEDKTLGNRTTEENAMLNNVLYELRMAFVTLQAK